MEKEFWRSSAIVRYTCGAAGIHLLLSMYGKQRTWVKTVADVAVPERVTGFSASEIVLTSSEGVASIVFSSDHNIESGDILVIENSSVPFYNGSWKVKVESATKITFPISSSVDDDSGTATAYVKIPFSSEIMLKGRKAYQADNAGTVWIGQVAEDGKQPIDVVAGGEVFIKPGTGEIWDLADFFVDVSNAGDGIVVLC